VRTTCSQSHTTRSPRWNIGSSCVDSALRVSLVLQALRTLTAAITPAAVPGVSHSMSAVVTLSRAAVPGAQHSAPIVSSPVPVDVVALHDVSAAALELIARDAFVRTHYHLVCDSSSPNDSTGAGGAFGSVILSRHRPSMVRSNVLACGRDLMNTRTQVGAMVLPGSMRAALSIAYATSSARSGAECAVVVAAQLSDGVGNVTRREAELEVRDVM
jgi:hypothetical protein